MVTTIKFFFRFGIYSQSIMLCFLFFVSRTEVGRGTIFL